ncbi:phosphomethylpyrimidine kinase [Listeria weihenstephanensis FSL R9-0317]|uniref:Hydroxymethylpyrimidine/phosphomethylpyrimidine kinase n=1 Tax=Listeria weihenstephanensis TaxID=1006155 RepID=A0A1S7FXT5_9LIST|nr:bifunctional hydroxymethylpyrimidine kinase/phosphomethylpyrimidine kinase [Listeria weihenstephanensis]AQY52246.1 phosphomethylpyrimidine kinase [Listeria weihenstephanensis]EUJ35358.1 phosphomethylpyrimidine kinase [Listeria weihenstephanensis FSL R9-0317]
MFPQAVTIAGSDSGGGAGIQADIKTFQERRVFGMSAITAITAQNTKGVQAIHPVPIDILEAQLDALNDDFAISAVKTGMLVDEAHIASVISRLQRFDWGPLIVDPVMIAKGGARLVSNEAIATIRENLLPLATIVTPNIPEAEVIAEMSIESTAQIKKAAKRIQLLGVKTVIIKGGHSEDKAESRDYVLDGENEFWLEAKRVKTKQTHGTGCTFSACITAELAKGASTEYAIQTAKKFITSAISQPLNIGHGNGPTNHWAHRKESQE